MIVPLVHRRGWFVRPWATQSVARPLATLVMAYVFFGIWPLEAQQTRPYADPNGRFALQYPRSDWRVLPGAGATLATLAENRGRATVLIEYVRLNQPLKVDQNHDLIVQIESDLIRERQPGATDVTPGTARADRPSVVIIDYTRPGTGGPERIRQFSIVSDQHLFRILCVAATKDFTRYEPVFEQIARSFQITLKS